MSLEFLLEVLIAWARRRIENRMQSVVPKELRPVEGCMKAVEVS